MASRSQCLLGPTSGWDSFQSTGRPPTEKFVYTIDTKTLVLMGVEFKNAEVNPSSFVEVGTE